MDLGLLKRRSDFEWEIAPQGAMRVPAVIFASEALMRDMDNKVYEQAVNVATLPGIVKASYAMPDAHWGYGFPIGGVMGYTPVTHQAVIAAITPVARRWLLISWWMAGGSSRAQILAWHCASRNSWASAAPSGPAFATPCAAGSTCATSGGAKRTSISPSASSGSISNYLVYVNQSRVGSSTTTSYTVTGLGCATSYSLAVAAVDSNGRVSATANASAATLACPTAPRCWTATQSCGRTC